MSGFLISTILFESLIEKKFSFFGFYLRRAKRIFPSLIVILVVCYIIGWNVLFPSELRGLSKHIFGGSIFLSNFVSFLENGYFDVSADFKPLLHLWSLGIEEQFYIIWPLILWLSWKKKSVVKIVIISSIVISFALNIFTIQTNSNAAFYLPHTRFWELLIGSLLAYLTIFEKEKTLHFSSKYANQLSIFGAVLLAISLILISKDNAFPGWWALLPTIAAASLIMAGPGAWVNRNILSLPFMIWFGLISFPLYLWHWPLLSFARILFGEHVTPQIICAMIGLAVALSWLTYKFVETPIRFGASENKSYYSLTAILAVIGVIGLFSFKQEGQKGLPREFLKSNQVSISAYDGGDMGETTAGCGPNKSELDSTFSICTKDRREEPKYVLLGDSKALALFPALVRTSHQGGRWALVGGNGLQGPVAPILSTEKIYAAYQKGATTAIDKVLANPGFEKIVIVAATRGIFSLNNVYSIEDLNTNKNFDIALTGVQNFTKQLLRAEKPIVFVVDNPTFRDPDQCMPRKLRPEIFDQFVNGKDHQECRIKITDQARLAKKYMDLLERVKALNPALISILDTTDALCDTATGYCSMTKNGRLLYGYTDHVSDYGAGLVGKKLNDYVSTQ